MFAKASKVTQKVNGRSFSAVLMDLCDSHYHYLPFILISFYMQHGPLFRCLSFFFVNRILYEYDTGEISGAFLLGGGILL